MTRKTGTITAHQKDPRTPSITVTDEQGTTHTVKIWYDRKFHGLGLRMGDSVAIQQNKRGEWLLKELLAVGDIEQPLDFDGHFPQSQADIIDEYVKEHHGKSPVDAPAQSDNVAAA